MGFLLLRPLSPPRTEIEPSTCCAKAAGKGRLSQKGKQCPNASPFHRVLHKSRKPLKLLSSEWMAGNLSSFRNSHCRKRSQLFFVRAVSTGFDICIAQCNRRVFSASLFLKASSQLVPLSPFFPGRPPQSSPIWLRSVLSL